MAAGAVILLVEDNPNINAINRKALTMEGHRVLEAATLQEAQAMLQTHGVDLIVLDILLPDGSGLDFCETLRETSSVPILFLTALGDNRQIVEGLRIGGDDYLTKPYDIDALIARIEALLRRVALDRTALEESEQTQYGPLRIYPDENRVTVDGADAYLTPREVALFRYLLRHPEKVHSSAALYRAIWHMESSDSNAIMRVHINALRRKLNLMENPVLTLETEYRQGYRMVVRKK